MAQTDHTRPARLLLVEDNPGDVRLIEEAFTDTHPTNELHVVTRGESALTYLEMGDDGEGKTGEPHPDLILLDLNLPGMSGIDVLNQIKSNGMSRVPVIVLTSSSATDDVKQSYENGANAYLTKPADPAAFDALARTVMEFWFETAKSPPDGSTAT